MKKYVAVIAAIAVAGAAGVYYVNDNMSNAPDTGTSAPSSYSQSVNNSEGNKTVENKNEQKTTTTTISTKGADEKHSFKAEIDSVSGDLLIIIPDKNSDEAKTCDRITLGLKNVKVVDSNGKTVLADDVKNFNSITIIYDGNIMETYPAQIKASKVILSDRSQCNVYFKLESGETIHTLTVPVNSALESADMPNAGAYCPDGYHFEGWMLGTKTVYGIEKIDDSVSLIAKIRKD